MEIKTKKQEMCWVIVIAVRLHWSLKKILLIQVAWSELMLWPFGGEIHVGATLFLKKK